MTRCDSAPRAGRRRLAAWRAVALSSTLVLASAALALDDEPRRVAGVAFGDSIEAVGKSYPGWTGMQAGAPVMSFYRVDAQSYEELRPCGIVFGFFEDRLYQVRYDCGSDTEIGALLRQRFGSPTTVNDKQDVWAGERTTIAVNRATRAFSFTDNALARAMSAYVLEQGRAQRSTPDG